MLFRSQHPANPWPLAYRAVVLLASWDPVEAFTALREAPEATRREPVLHALEDLSGGLSGRLPRMIDLRDSLPLAIADVKKRLERSSLPLQNKAPAGQIPRGR